MERINCNQLPRMMTVRQVAKTGMISEYALRQLVKQGKVPCIALEQMVFASSDSASSASAKIMSRA